MGIDFVISQVPHSTSLLVISSVAFFIIVGIISGLATLKPLEGFRRYSGKNYSRYSRDKDQLQQVLYDLENSTLATRAGKLGTATLRNLWRLNNPFVSDSVLLQREYRASLLRSFKSHTPEIWDGVALSTANAVKPLLFDQSGATRCNVKMLSRRATLAAVLKSLFDIDDVDVQRLDFISEEIHRLTVAKKHFDAGASRAEFLPTELQLAADRLIANLKELFGNAKRMSPLAKHILCSVSGDDDHYNPLNLVIPAFEAPWRATFYTLLALLQANTPDRLGAIATLRDCKDGASPPPAALAIIYESLRLYPPIRRVRREKRVDIEAVQRSGKYWGTSACIWNPSRFLDSEGCIQKHLLQPSSAWMPFAIGTMSCPSSNGYSARFLVVTVGELLRQLFPGKLDMAWNLSGPEWLSEDQAGRLLRAGRDEYASVQVIIPNCQPK